MTSTDSLLPGAPAPYFLDQVEGDKLVVFDQLFTLLTTKSESEGQFDAFFNDGNPGRPVPPHFHAKTHETFFVVSGAVRIWMDDRNGFRETRILEEGGFAYVPKNVVHSYQMVKTGRIFGVTSAGFSDFFRVIGKPHDKAGIPDPQDFHIPSPEFMAQQGAIHDVNFIEGYELWD